MIADTHDAPCPLGSPTCRLEPERIRERCFRCTLVTEDADPARARDEVLACAVETGARRPAPEPAITD